MNPLSRVPRAVMAGLIAAFASFCTGSLNAQTLNNTFGGLSESSDQPIDIASDTLTILANDYALFSGNVKAVQGTTTLRAKELKVHYLAGDTGEEAGRADAKAPQSGAVAPGAVPAAPAARGGAAPTADTKTVNTEGSSNAPTATAAGTVSDEDKSSPDDPIDIQSDWLLVHDKEKYAQFKGNVRVVRGDTKLRSKELTVNFEGGESLSAATETNDASTPAAQITKIEARGEVRALLTPKGSAGSEPAKKPAEAAPGAVAAQTPAPSTPVRSASNDAAGASAPTTAASSGGSKPAVANNAAAAPQDDGTADDKNRQITKLEAMGDVVITSEDDETSTSDWAIYDMPSELVTIGGNVVLTQNETVLKGDRLVIDLRTGESRFENTGTAATGGRRIRALFLPKDGAKPGAKPKMSVEDGGNGGADPDDALEPPAVDDSEPLPLVPEFR